MGRKEKYTSVNNRQCTGVGTEHPELARTAGTGLAPEKSQVKQRNLCKTQSQKCLRHLCPGLGQNAINQWEPWCGCSDQQGQGLAFTPCKVKCDSLRSITKELLGSVG